MTTTKDYTPERILHDLRGPVTGVDRGTKLSELDTLLAVAEDYSIGDKLIEWAHGRLDEVAEIVGAALAPWTTQREETE